MHESKGQVPVHIIWRAGLWVVALLLLVPPAALCVGLIWMSLGSVASAIGLFRGGSPVVTAYTAGVDEAEARMLVQTIRDVVQIADRVHNMPPCCPVPSA